MNQVFRHIISQSSKISEALHRMDALASDATLFVVNEENSLIGSLTDGDIRRGLMKGYSLEVPVSKFANLKPKYLLKDEYTIDTVIELRKGNYLIIPILDNNNKIIKVINFKEIRSYLPIDTVIMAGGMGQRLLPLTLNIPKPLLKVGEKPIIEHNIDRLANYGIDDFWITIKYLGNKISEYLRDGSSKNINIEYICENEPLGTIGAVSMIKNFKHETILLTNSDILTNLDYEDFYLDFIRHQADLSILTIPYKIDIPYAVLETSNNVVLRLKEKPTYTYFSNGGIYLIKKECLNYLPKNTHFNATDLIEKLITINKKIISYPLSGYWLDVGKHEDFEKAQIDIKHIKF